MRRVATHLKFVLARFWELVTTSEVEATEFLLASVALWMSYRMAQVSGWVSVHVPKEIGKHLIRDSGAVWSVWFPPEYACIILLFVGLLSIVSLIERWLVIRQYSMILLCVCWFYLSTIQFFTVGISGSGIFTIFFFMSSWAHKRLISEDYYLAKNNSAAMQSPALVRSIISRLEQGGLRHSRLA